MTPPPPPPPAAARPRRRRLWKRIGIGAGAVLLVAGGIGYWALDEYVIDHVAISDVAAYEAAQTAASSGTASSSGAASSGSASSVGAATSAMTASATTAAATAAAGATKVAATGAAVSTSATGAADVAALGGTVTTVVATTTTSSGATVTISKVVTGSGSDTVTTYVADVVVPDGETLRSGFADNSYGENIVADTSDIAEQVGAMFAINGDYYGFRSTGIMIRNGVVYRDEGTRTGLAVYRDGRMEVYDETTTSAQELLDAGVWNTLSFGPALVDDGAVVDGITQVEVDTNVGNHSIQGNQPRTAVGMISANHFVFVVVDGRSTGYSRGVTLPELASIMQTLGATEAYNLDGGGSSTMVFDGRVVNNPLGKGQERGTSDILYVA